MQKIAVADLYQHLKRRIDVRQLLEYYGAEHVSEIVSSDGTTELVHSCLLDRVEPHHANHDFHPSAWVNVDKGLYCCSVFWAGDILHLVQKLEGQETLQGIMPVIQDFLQGATKDSRSFRQEIERLFAESIYSIDLPSYSERVLDPWAKSHPYMREVRGISQEVHELLRIGYDEKENRIVFPHFWQDRLVGWQRRAIPETPNWPGTYPQWPKYKSSVALPKSETLYAYDLAQKASCAIVVESPMSVARAYTLGVPSAIATFGAKVSRHQINLLKEFPRLIVWFDADKAGQSGARKLVEGLYRHVEVLVVEPDKDKDLGDYETADQVAAKLDQAKAAPLWLAEQDREMLR